MTCGSRIKILVCWSLISGYMAACWRALAAREDVRLKVLAFRPDEKDNIDFGMDILAGLDVALLDRAQRVDWAHVEGLAEDFAPDVMIISGWSHRAYLSASRQRAKRGARIILTMDNSLQLNLRQIAGKLVRPLMLRHVDSVLVAGERAAIMAKFLGFRESQIFNGVYGYDSAAFEGCMEERLARHASWPRNFLFVGRYVERKALDTLIEAYRRYRQSVPEPWSLICCGRGPLERLVESEPGCMNRGFVQPRELREQLIEAGAFVLPSRFEAWGVALAEAAGAGLPLICSSSVGAGVELVRDHYNGRVFATDDVEQLAEMLRWMHERQAVLEQIGERSRQMAAPFGSRFWSERVYSACVGLLRSSRCKDARGEAGQ